MENNGQFLETMQADRLHAKCSHTRESSKVCQSSGG